MKLDFLASDSSAGPLLRLWEFTPAEAAALFVAVAKLATGGLRDLHVHHLPFVQATGGCGLTLRVHSSHQAVVHAVGAVDFECACTAEEWDNVAGLIAPFAHGARGYQWLSEAQGDARLLLSVDGTW